MSMSIWQGSQTSTVESPQAVWATNESHHHHPETL